MRERTTSQMDPLTKAELQLHRTEGHTHDRLVELRRAALVDARAGRATELRRLLPPSYLASEEARLLDGARRMFVDCKVFVETRGDERFIVIDWS